MLLFSKSVVKDNTSYLVEIKQLCTATSW